MTSIPLHTVNFFQRPAQGNAFLRRMQAYGYRHKISAMGWFDTMSCDVRLQSIDEADQFLNDFIGARVAAYVDNPVEPVWEGLVNRLTFDAGNWSYTVSLDAMANRASVISTGSTGATQRSTVSNNTASQAIYGIKEGQVDIGYTSNAGTTKINALAATILAERAYPQSSITQQSGGSILVHVECIGFFYTLTWEKPFGAAGNVAFNTMITGTYLPGLANGATFFDNTDFTDISTNATLQQGDSRTGASYWDLIRGMAETGDGTQLWVAGIGPTNFLTRKRRLYFRAANSAIEYTARRGDGLRIRDLYGNIYPPWLVKPDRGVRVTDMLPGWSGVGDDPRLTYIFSVDYDADAQRASYTGADDTRYEGAFQLKTIGKPFGTPFGAPTRVTTV
jgi:hypothetical protein